MEIGQDPNSEESVGTKATRSLCSSGKDNFALKNSFIHHMFQIAVACENITQEAGVIIQESSKFQVCSVLKVACNSILYTSIHIYFIGWPKAT